MNCPQCYQPVGEDQFRTSKTANPVFDDYGTPSGRSYTTYVDCDHCGLFWIERDEHDGLLTVIRMIRATHIKRVFSLLPVSAQRKISNRPFATETR